MLRAGTQTGSLTNHVYSRCKDAAPTIGEGGTLLMWTDSHAVTIVEVSASGKRIGVKRDKAKRVLREGDPVMSDSQQYTYETDDSAPVTRSVVMEAGHRKDRRWVPHRA